MHTENAYAAYLESPEELEAILERYVLGLEALFQEELPLDIRQVYQSLVVTEWHEYLLSEYQKGSIKPENHVVFKPIVGDIGYRYVCDQSGNRKYLSIQDYQDLCQQEAEFERIVRDNFTAHYRANGLKVHSILEDAVVGIELDGNFKKTFPYRIAFGKN